MTESSKKTFCVQEHTILPDFCYEVLRAIEFQNWMHPDSIRVLRAKDGLTEAPIDAIPVGSLEFVKEFVSLKLGITASPLPLNIPEPILESAYVGRNYWKNISILSLSNLYESLPDQVFVKSSIQYKLFNADIVYKKELQKIILTNGNIDISEVVEIDDEWRIFVHNHEFVDLKCYTKKFKYVPNYNFIDNLVCVIKKSMPNLNSYTLDIGFIDGKQSVVEMHHFVGCGLYGFRDYSILLNMVASGYKSWVQDSKFS